MGEGEGEGEKLVRNRRKKNNTVSREFLIRRHARGYWNNSSPRCSRSAIW